MVQINFDAWSHADAENLWASLTAELFDQLADAIEGRHSDGKLKTGLMTEIAKRLRKDAEALPLAAGAVEFQRAVVQGAETTLASLDDEPVAATVASEMAQDLIAKATPKTLSEEDKKKPEKVREAKEAEETSGSTSCWRPAGYRRASAIQKIWRRSCRACSTCRAALGLYSLSCAAASAAGSPTGSAPPWRC